MALRRTWLEDQTAEFPGLTAVARKMMIISATNV